MNYRLSPAPDRAAIIAMSFSEFEAWCAGTHGWHHEQYRQWRREDRAAKRKAVGELPKPE